MCYVYCKCCSILNIAFEEIFFIILIKKFIGSPTQDRKRTIIANKNCVIKKSKYVHYSFLIASDVIRIFMFHKVSFVKHKAKVSPNQRTYFSSIFGYISFIFEFSHFVNFDLNFLQIIQTYILFSIFISVRIL